MSFPENDKYYKSLIEGGYDPYSYGWFDDKLPSNWCVPRDIKYSYPLFNLDLEKLKDEKPVVLVSTGGFNPVHVGHFGMMAAAKKKLEQKGFSVLGGYLVPDHTSYVTEKVSAISERPKVLSGVNRILLIEEYVKNNPEYSWIAANPIGVFGYPCAVNFTTILAELEDSLMWTLNKSVEVVYVCGADNHRLSWALKEQGRCVIVSRGGYNWPDTPSSDRILITEGGNESFISSTDLRAVNFSSYIRTPPRKLKLRGVKSYKSEKLQSIFKDYFDEVIFCDSREQHSMFSRSVNCYTPIINLDKHTDISSYHWSYNISTSRVYDRGGFRHLGYEIDKDKISSIRPGDYLVVDDDLVTGGTISHLKSHLPTSVTIAGLYIHEHTDRNEYEILDVEDFYVRTLYNKEGLKVQYKAPSRDIIRMEYNFGTIASFRASIPEDKLAEFKKRL